MTYVLGWQAPLPWPRQREFLEPDTFYCCGSFDPSTKVFAPLRTEDLTGKQLISVFPSSTAGAPASINGERAFNGLQIV